MLERLYEGLPPESVKILLVLGLSLLVGLEREEHKTSTDHPTFGGVRTFPLIGLIGYSMALLGGGQLLPLTLGFAVVAGFLFLSYWHRFRLPGLARVTVTWTAPGSIGAVGMVGFGASFQDCTRHDLR